MGFEKVQEKTSQKQNLARWASRAMAVGTAAVTLAFVMYQNYDESGEIIAYNPIKKGQVEIDDELRVLSWNMHGETQSRLEELEATLIDNDVDIAALQEVSASDAEALHGHFSDLHINFVMADAKSNALEGGFGNILMSRQEQNDISSVSIEGNSVAGSALKTVEGFVVDAAKADTSFSNTKAGTQEDRAAIASAIQVQNEERLENVEVITSHIGSPDRELHESQYKKLKSFISKTSGDNRAAIFCGDLNYGPDRVVGSFIENGFYVHQTLPTNTKGQTLDYCGYHPGGILTTGKVEILDNYTDHYALLGTWQTRP